MCARCSQGVCGYGLVYVQARLLRPVGEADTDMAYLSAGSKESASLSSFLNGCKAVFVSMGAVAWPWPHFARLLYGHGSMEHGASHAGRVRLQTHCKVVTSQVNSRQHASASGTFILPMWSHAWHHTLAVCVGVVQSGCHTLPMLTVLLVCP